MELDDEASKKGASQASATAYARNRALCGPVPATASNAHLAQAQPAKTTRAGHAQSASAQTAKISKERMAQTAQTTHMAGHMAHTHMASGQPASGI
jgi:hypothetical protein